MDTLRAVIQDVKWFLFLLVLTVWGFTCSFYILFRQDQQYEVHSSMQIAAVLLHSKTAQNGMHAQPYSLA